MKKQYIVPSTCQAEMLMESMILSSSSQVGPHIPIGSGSGSFSDPGEFV